MAQSRGQQTYPELHVVCARLVLHGGFGSLGILAKEHFDKGMALVLVDNTRLHSPVAGKELTQLVLGTSVSRFASAVGTRPQTMPEMQKLT
jgi:hypothetical protein